MYKKKLYQAVTLFSILIIFIMQLVNFTSTEILNTQIQYLTKTLLSENTPQKTGPEIGITAPDFNYKNTNNQDTSLVSLGNKKTKILVFSSIECPYCKSFYPEIEKFIEKHTDVSITVMQLNSTIVENKKLITDNNYNFEILAVNPQIFKNYQISHTPTTVILNKNDVIKNSKVLSKYEELEDILANSI